ncbi:hypothetical protein HN766_27660 [Candidatus Poribacteria bacterium]|nr:hypothetical protein [Candidatus Poribacteria bacterium]
MSQYLAVVDTSGIQPYIFNGNRMRENIGASSLVALATREWALDALPTPNNVHRPQGGGDVTLSPGGEGLAAQVVCAAGGNVVVIFQSEDASRKFAQNLSRFALERAPGLRLIVARVPFCGTDSFHDQLKEAFTDLNRKKRAAVYDQPLLGVGPTVMCRWTGFPATGIVKSAGEDDPGYPASPETLAKSRAGQPGTGAADVRLRKDFLGLPSMRTGPFTFPSKFDDLGGTEGEANYIAVVHADGNGMGDRIRRITKEVGQGEDAAAKLTEFSEALALKSLQALQTTVARLARSARRHPPESGGWIVPHPVHSGVPPVSLRRDKNASSRTFHLPMRPLVFGGDDVTFVCDGRLGISLAIAYLEAFEAATADLSNDDDPVTACAGVAIVATHYPFAQAYTLAEELCSSAKKYHRELLEEHGGRPTSAIDWHFTTGGLYGSLAAIRQREYQFESDAESLALRPLALQNDEADRVGRSWARLRTAVDAFQSEEWQSQRNKLKALLATMSRSKDPKEIEAFRMRYLGTDQLPDLCLPETAGNYRDDAWIMDDSIMTQPIQRNVYFDAAEAVDWFIPLAETGASDAT